jgi:flagellar hook-length control protein FliK
VTLIPAPLASRPAPTVAPAASATAQPGAFASILQGVLRADASAGTETDGDAATGDSLDTSLSALAEALMSRPAGQQPAGEPADDHHVVLTPADATTPDMASPLPVMPAVATTAATAETNQEAAEPAPTLDAAIPASASPSTPGETSDSARPEPGPTTDDSAADPTLDPAPAGPVPPTPPTATGAGQTPVQAQLATARVERSRTLPPSAAVPVEVPGTPAPAAGVTRTAGSTSPVATTIPTAAVNGQAGAASPPAEVTGSVPSPALPANLQAAEPALAPVAAVPPPAAAPAAATAPPAPAHSAPPAPTQPLTTQLAQPLFSLAGARPGEHSMTVQVTPENLGPVTVRAVISADDIRIELFSPSEGGREALRQILSDLRRDLAGGGLSASLDLSSKNEPGSSEERTPLREAPRPGAAAPEPVIEQRSAPASTATTTLDVTV